MSPPVDLDDPDKMMRYLARPAEIDAFATGAAAEIIARISHRFAARRQRYGDSPVDADEWNEAIVDAIRDGVYALPNHDYNRYISNLNDRLQDVAPAIKAKFITKVKNRFLRTFYTRLMAYKREPVVKPRQADSGS